MTDQEKSSLRHIEERLDRLVVVLDEKIDTLRADLEGIIANNDLRYQQRFEAQGKALDAAFGAAKGAVDAALAGADKASVKTEQTADKRFSDLGDLIREQFKGLTNKIEALADRVVSTENRLNQSSGEERGVSDAKNNMRALWGLGVSIFLALLVAIGFLWSLKP